MVRTGLHGDEGAVCCSGMISVIKLGSCFVFLPLYTVPSVSPVAKQHIKSGM
jgi:hypothetical protein